MKIRLSLVLALVVSTSLCAQPPKRVVSASGNISEVIAKLGKAENLVGVDTTSLIPKDVMKDIAKVGYRRNLSAEGILSLSPDLLLLAPDAGPETVLAQLRQAGLKTLIIEDKQTPESVKLAVSQLATLFELPEKGQQIITEIDGKLAKLAKTRKKYSATPNIAFMLDTGSGSLNALGLDSAGDNMIRLVGGNNVFADNFSSFKSVSAESILAEDPDIILLAARISKDLGSGIKRIKPTTNQYQFLTPSRAAKQQCIYQVDIVQSLGFGVSFVDSANLIADRIEACIKNN